MLNEDGWILIMTNKRKSSARIDQADFVSLDTIHININGNIYTSRGSSYADSLMEAVDNHVAQDGEFTEYISVSAPGEGTEEIYSPAVLCTFGYIGKDELAGFLVANLAEKLEEEDEPENN
jgi:hypothetical protein